MKHKEDSKVLMKRKTPKKMMKKSMATLMSMKTEMRKTTRVIIISDIAIESFYQIEFLFS